MPDTFLYGEQVILKDWKVHGSRWLVVSLPIGVVVITSFKVKGLIFCM